MSEDGLRAWIGEVERKLGKRTRVFLVLAVIAIGGAGAAVYLAIDAQNDAVSESDVQALQQQLEARIDESGGSGATEGAAVAQIQAELDELREQVEGLSGETGSGASGGGAKGKGEGKAKGAGGGPGGEGANPSGGASTEGPHVGASGGDSAAKLQELLEEAKKKSEENE